MLEPDVLTASEAEKRALAEAARAAELRLASDILKQPRPFLLPEQPVDRIDTVNVNLHLGETTLLEAKPVGAAPPAEEERPAPPLVPAELVPEEAPPPREAPVRAPEAGDASAEHAADSGFVVPEPEGGRPLEVPPSSTSIEVIAGT